MKLSKSMCRNQEENTNALYLDALESWTEYQ